MTFEKLCKDLEVFNNLKETLLLDILFFIKDQAIPLEQRWKVFSESWCILPNDSYGDGNIDILDKSSLYDDFFIDGYQTGLYIKMYEDIQEEITSGLISQEKADAWREAVLADGCASFIYDW